ncbi:MAG: helix-turn-helix domain-containing protein [Candidatus Aenigmatarchaeota archaeon]
MVSIDEFCAALQQSGYFDELEIKVLQAMLMLRRERQIKCNANTIASAANVSVTNAYKYLYSLQEKGLVESSKDKNKIFWLSASADPFPRFMSHVIREYMAKKDLFERLSGMYGKLVPLGDVWGGEKIRENYEKDFLAKAAFIVDISRVDVLMVLKQFSNDCIFIDSLRRAAERGVKIRVIAEEVDSNLSDKLRKIGIEMRLGKAWPFVIVSDGRHGITQEFGDGGRWFLNIPTDYKEKFEEFWKKSEKV